MSDPVLIIGAGVAGLSAATALRQAGLDCLIVEASNRIGGRAHTTRIGAHPFDHGASWLHDAERNPLTTIARAHTEPLIDSDAVRTRRMMIGNRPATEAELAARTAAWKQFDAVAMAETRDLPLATVIDSLRDNPWIASIEAWEACQIAAADPRDFSVLDWNVNQLDGRNLALPNGIGDFVLRRLAPQAGPIRLNTPVTHLNWHDRIQAETPAGTITAAACIVTISTAALARLRLTPNLPVSPDGLPMGLLTKIALRATGANRLGLAADQSVNAQIARDTPMLSLFAWPNGADHAVAFIGGPPAWTLARQGHAATIDFVRGRLRDWFGTEADRTFGDATVTTWAEDPNFGGSYAYARPGHAGDRAQLGTPLADGRLIIAGEATANDGLAGTVAGAWNEGARAAATVAAALAHRV
jgi:monoamine oxidase